VAVTIQNTGNNNLLQLQIIGWKSSWSKRLHWLPVQTRDCVSRTVVHTWLASTAPTYLCHADIQLISEHGRPRSVHLDLWPLDLEL